MNTIFKFKNKTAGFTLIELLVVISIIGMLSSVILSALNTARAKGRDATLITSAQELQKAVSLYYHDNGVYPPQTPIDAGTCPTAGGSMAVSCYTGLDGVATESVLGNALVPTYMPVLPESGVFNNPNKASIDSQRLLYRLITNPAAIAGAGCTAAAKNCYAILLYTEKNTSISTANIATYFLSNGTIKKGYSATIY